MKIAPDISNSRMFPATTAQFRAEYYSHYQRMADDDECELNTLWFALGGLALILLIGLSGLIHG